MNSIRHIREKVLGLTQTQLALLTGVTQGTVSRWETGKLEPTLDELRKMREAAQDKGVEWNDAWFFDAPKRKRGRPPFPASKSGRAA
jgi:transcriptional regulator with XRE-family HTH domain